MGWIRLDDASFDGIGEGAAEETYSTRRGTGAATDNGFSRSFLVLTEIRVFPAVTSFSVWWLRLGIAIERIKPGHPQQNGRHERMHLTLKKETTRPPGSNSLQRQERFDAFVREFNVERPHEALDMKCPAELYLTSPHRYDGLPGLIYPFHDREVLVTACGRLCLHRKPINISTVLAGQKFGIKEVDDGIWLASFMHYDLGYFDLEQKTQQPLDNPFGTRLSPMS
jgi:hypothetical protein